MRRLFNALEQAGLGTVEQFDLTDPKQVERLAADIGRAWTAVIAPIAAAMPEEHRGIFFGYLFGAPLGAMNAAIGLEDYDAVLVEIRKAVELVAEQKKRAQH